MPGPRLDDVVVPDAPRAVVLMLHGGRQTSDEPVLDRHASWWRMAVLARAVRSTLKRDGVALYLLQNRVRGWNDPRSPSPVADARWALDVLRERHGALPIILVGHSMGGRAACRVADDPAVVAVVGLAPWLPQAEPTTALAGKHLRVLHGTADRWTSARWSKDFVRRARSVAASAEWISLRGAGHYMFRRVRAWNRFVEDSVSGVLAEVAPAPED